MMNQTSPERVRQDSRLIGQTLLKPLPRLLLRAIVIAVALIIWYFVANWILDAGKRVSFEFLHSLGQPTMDMVQKFSPYLWWVGVGIWSLIVFFRAARLAERQPGLRPRHAGADRGAGRTGAAAVRRIAGRAALDLGRPRRTLHRGRPAPLAVSEIRHSRIAKIDMVARQAEILEGGGKPRAPATTTPRREPRADRYVEPRIGPDKRHPSAQPARSRRPGGFCISVLPASRSYTGLPRSQPRAARHTDTMRRRPRRGDRARPPGVRFPCSVLPSGSPPAWRCLLAARVQRGAALLPGPTSPSPSSPCSPPAAPMIWSPASSPRRSARR